MNILPFVTAMLRQHIGLNPESVGSSLILMCIHRRMLALNFADTAQYLDRLQSNVGELRLLVDEIVVPETWFFRYPESYRSLVQFVCDRWAPQNPGKTLRVLCIPCSTGEEAFSVAISLLESSRATRSFSIDAFDVSDRAIAKARLGRFPLSSFREKTSELSEKYFHREGDELVAKAELLSRVVFKQGNLIDPQFLEGEAVYDVIFCRNLMIYLDSSARQKGIEKLASKLHPEGIIFLGHAEPLSLFDPRFVSLEVSQAFGFKLRDPSFGKKTKQPTPLVDLKGKVKPAKSPPPAMAFVAGLGVSDTPAQTEEKLLANQTRSLAKVRRLANAGKIDEALRVLESASDSTAPDAEAFYLHGLLSQSKRDLRAAEVSFEKAVYCDPKHLPSLAQLALLSEQRGDQKAADNYRRRHERALKGGRSHEYR